MTAKQEGAAPPRAPWKAIAGRSNYRFEVEDSKGFTVCRVVGGLLDGGREKADLLAAAPDLREALLGALAWETETRQRLGLPQVDAPDWAQAARAALAKVAGRGNG